MNYICHGIPCIVLVKSNRKIIFYGHFDAWVNSRGSNMEKYIIILGVFCLAASKEDKIIHKLGKNVGFTLTKRKVGLVKRTARAEISSFPTGRGPDKNKCSAGGSL